MFITRQKYKYPMILFILIFITTLLLKEFDILKTNELITKIIDLTSLVSYVLAFMFCYLYINVSYFMNVY